MQVQCVSMQIICCEIVRRQTTVDWKHYTSYHFVLVRMSFSIKRMVIILQRHKLTDLMCLRSRYYCRQLLLSTISTFYSYLLFIYLFLFNRIGVVCELQYRKFFQHQVLQSATMSTVKLPSSQVKQFVVWTVWYGIIVIVYGVTDGRPVFVAFCRNASSSFSNWKPTLLQSLLLFIFLLL